MLARAGPLPKSCTGTKLQQIDARGRILPQAIQQLMAIHGRKAMETASPWDDLSSASEFLRVAQKFAIKFVHFAHQPLETEIADRKFVSALRRFARHVRISQ